MRLILTLFVLLFTQLFFNLAHAAPQARIAAEQRKSHVNEARPDDRKKKKAVKASKKVKVAAPEKKTKVAKTKSEKTAKKIVSAKSKTKSQKIAKIKVTPPKKGYKKGYGRHRSAGMLPPNWCTTISR